MTDELGVPDDWQVYKLYDPPFLAFVCIPPSTLTHLEELDRLEVGIQSLARQIRNIVQQHSPPKVQSRPSSLALATLLRMFYNNKKRKRRRDSW